MEESASVTVQSSKLVRIHNTHHISLPQKFVQRNRIDTQKKYWKNCTYEQSGVIRIVLIPLVSDEKVKL